MSTALRAQRGVPLPYSGGAGAASMYHTIQFTAGLVVHFERSRARARGQGLIPRGVWVRTRLKPYVVETADGPVEVADLFFGDGTTVRGVRFACFSFVN